MTNISGNKSTHLWLRSTEVVHFLGKEEVSGPNPLGASIIITIRYKDFYSVAE